MVGEFLFGLDRIYLVVKGSFKTVTPPSGIVYLGGQTLQCSGFKAANISRTIDNVKVFHAIGTILRLLENKKWRQCFH
jgi:hypothetical protein